MDRGLFRQGVAINAQPNMSAILATARQVASAMAFLHEHGIVHGDLTGGEILSLYCRSAYFEGHH